MFPRTDSFKLTIKQQGKDQLLPKSLTIMITLLVFEIRRIDHALIETFATLRLISCLKTILAYNY